MNPMKSTASNHDSRIGLLVTDQAEQTTRPATWDSANLSATVLAGVALVLFVMSILVPCIDIFEFGNRHSLSLIEGIRSLWDSGHAVLAVVVFAFTILFPPVKLVTTIVVSIPLGSLSNNSRLILQKAIAHLGKWSLLDVLVISILIVAVKVQGVVSVQAAIGTYLFTATILLSMLAGHTLIACSETTSGIMKWACQGRNVVATLMVAPRKRIVASIGLVLVGTGVGLISLSAGSSIEAIRVAKRDGLIDLSNLFGNPSFYVVVRTLEGPQRLETKRSTPIGGGLIWHLPQAVAVSQTRRVELWNSGLFRDRLVDQVETIHRRSAGQRFQFELVQQKPFARSLGMFTLVGGILLSAATLPHDLHTRQLRAN
jgi:paraquat-inducible protein A